MNSTSNLITCWETGFSSNINCLKKKITSDKTFQRFFLKLFFAHLSRIIYQMNSSHTLSFMITTLWLFFSVKPEHYLYTEDFLDAIGEQLAKNMK